MLRLQDLTKRGIERVCSESLYSLHVRFKEHHDTSSSGQSTPRLVIMLNLRAEGVFLWVHLALKSIERGVTNSYSWGKIQQRIRQLRTGLDELYKSMYQHQYLWWYIRANLNLRITALGLELSVHQARPDLISVLGLMIESESYIQESLVRLNGQSLKAGVLSGACCNDEQDQVTMWWTDRVQSDHPLLLWGLAPLPSGRARMRWYLGVLLN